MNEKSREKKSQRRGEEREPEGAMGRLREREREREMGGYLLDAERRE